MGFCRNYNKEPKSKLVGGVQKSAKLYCLDRPYLVCTSQAGLTYFNRSTSTLAAYKTHIEDPILWRDGMRLRFRNCEETAGCGDMNHCPNQFCSTDQRAQQLTASPLPSHVSSKQGDVGDVAEYSTLVFTYEWPKSANELVDRTSAALRMIQNLVSVASLNEAAEDAATDRVLDGDDGIVSLLTAFSEVDLSQEMALRLARQLGRQAAKAPRLRHV